MKLVVQVKLLPSPEQAAALEATLRACNRAADHVSQTVFQTGIKDRNGLQKLVYTDIKATFGLSAQPAVRVVKKVVDAYGALTASLQAGRLGNPGAKRYRKAVGSPVTFHPEAAQPFDDRCLSWQTDARTVSIWTVDGRMRGIRYVGSPDQLKTLAEYRKGESDLVQRGGKWFLIATCDLPDPEAYEPSDWIGVDRGIVNLATTSDGTNYQGRRLGRYRRWQARKRAELQAKGTRSATRRLACRAKKEQHHATHVNHRISKEIVSVAQRTGRGIAVEELDGIRERVRLRRDQRGTLSSWPFHQLGQHLAYKARRAGVPFLQWMRPTPRSAARAAGTRSGPTGPTGTISVVVGAASLGPPTTSPGSTCATAPARRGCSSPHPSSHRPEDAELWGDATRDRPVVGGSRERDEVRTTEYANSAVRDREDDKLRPAAEPDERVPAQMGLRCG